MAEWINTEDGIPEDHQEVLMIYNDFVMPGKFVNGKFWYVPICVNCIREEQEGVTYWMLFPKNPYQKKD